MGPASHILSLRADPDDATHEIAALTLEFPDNCDCPADGDLALTYGNLYLYIDGVEYGSLWAHRDKHGQPLLTLGQYDHTTEQWEERSALRPIKDPD